MDPNTKFLASRATRKMSHKNEAPQNSEVKTDRAMCFFIQVYFSFFVSHLPTHWYNVAGCVSEGGRERGERQRDRQTDRHNSIAYLPKQQVKLVGPPGHLEMGT